MNTHERKGLNMCTQLSSRGRCLKFGLSLHLCPFFVCVSSKGSGETGQIPMLV